MKIRILRVLEYEYDDADCMMSDIARWGVGANNVERHGKVVIRSATMLPHPFDLALHPKCGSQRRHPDRSPDVCNLYLAHAGPHDWATE